MSDGAVEDKTYSDAALYTLGKAIASLYCGMVDGGMEHDDALQLAIEYVVALVNKP